MDFLKRSASPISTEAWDEIDKTAKNVFKNLLSARKILAVNGPKGLDYTAIEEGRLEELDSPKFGEVCTGSYKLKRLVEARISFKLSKWELDNINRGAKDINLDALEEACEKIAVFEEQAIYNGYKKGDIEGLIPSATHKFKLGKDGNSILKAIGDGKYALMNSYVEMPYDLVVSKEVYDQINIIFEGAHLIQAIENIIGGKVIRSKVVTGAVMLPTRHEDLEFTIGQDLAVGYESEDGGEVQLFVTESFTLRVLDGNKIVAFTK